MHTNVLIADDDPHIRELVRHYLEREAYAVFEANDGLHATDILAAQNIHLAILDVMMPHKDGWELCKEIRTYYDIPIVLLTAKGELEDKARGFQSGTDDYLVKPFQPEELLFRIKALLRRYRIVTDDIIHIHDTILDRNQLLVRIGEERIPLPLKEFELLVQLASYPNRTFTRDQLLEQVWGYDYEGDSRTIDVHIKRLRERLRGRTTDFTIATVRGLGYRLEVASK